MVVAACQYEGGLVINVQPSDPTIDRIRLYVSTGEETPGAQLEPAHASALIDDVSRWNRDPMNELDHMLISPGESARFVFVHTDADELTALIAVGYSNEQPIAVASRYRLPIPDDVFAVHDVALGAASSDPSTVAPAVWIEPWSPSADTPSSEAACIGVVDGQQKSFIVTSHDPDCDDYKTDSAEECDPKVYRQNRLADLTEMVCLATAPSTSCSLGGPTCIDGEVHDPRACKPTRYCAPTSLCTMCGADLACAQDITVAAQAALRPTSIACTIPTQLTGMGLCQQTIEVKLPLSGVTARTVSISDPSHAFSSSIQVGTVTLEVRVDTVGRIALLPSGTVGPRSEIGALLATELSNGRGFAIPLTVTFGGGGCATQGGVCIVTSSVSDSLACVAEWSAPMQAIPGLGRSPTLTPDLLQIFYTPADGNGEILSARRPSVTSPWTSPVDVAELTPMGTETVGPSLAQDGLSMYLAVRLSSGTTTDFDINLSTRASLSGTWSLPVPITDVIMPGPDLDPAVDQAQLHMVYSADRNNSGRQDLWERSRPNALSPWGAELKLGVSSPENDISPHLSANGLEIYFSSDRMRSQGLGYELFVAKRASVTLPFGPPSRIADLGGPADEVDPWLDRSGTVMFFASNTSGGFQIYEARR